MNKDFWMAKHPGGLGDGGEMAYDNSSRVEPKRSQQWFMDGTEAELFPNKKQAVEDPNHTSFSGLLNSTNISPWGNALSFTERLFDPENVRSNDFDTRNNASVGIGSMNLGREVIEDPFVSNSTFGLPVSNLLEDPRSGLNYGGIKKVKVSQVKDSENFMSVSVGPDYVGGYNNTMSTSRAYKEAGDTSVTMGLSFNNGDENVKSMRDNFKGADSNFISMGQSYDKGDNSHISIGQTYEENNTAILMGHSLIKDESNSMKMRETFTEGDKDTISMSHTFKDGNHILPVGQLFSKDDSNITSMGQIFNKMDNIGPSMGLSLNNGESTIISFGGLNDDDNANPSGRLECSYDLLTGQSLLQSSEARSGKWLRDSNADIISCATQLTNRGDPLSKKTEEQKPNKKAPQNNFPSNVRSLLSTGMLDGVPVKYVGWSQEKELRGIIQGSGYLCGCQLCNLSKAINAYEFERHAGCKTKHPNNHIYFENGKTIYGIVQELRNTPQNLLFEVIQTITGSPINQKSFRLWKESFLAATRELQRIYGKEEGKHFS